MQFDYFYGSQAEQFSFYIIIRNSLGTFRHKQDSTLVAEQTAIFSTSGFLRVNI